MIPTKQKQASHLKGGDQIVLTAQASGKQFVYPIVGTRPYEREQDLPREDRMRGPWIEVGMTYELSEPDGRGGQKMITKKCNVLYREHEQVQVVA